MKYKSEKRKSPALQVSYSVPLAGTARPCHVLTSEALYKGDGPQLTTTWALDASFFKEDGE